MASKYHRVYQGFQKLFNPSAKKRSDIPTTIIGVKPKVNKTKLDKAKSKLAITTQKAKAAGAKLKQTLFESKNKAFKGDDFTFATNKKKTPKVSEQKATGGRVGKMGGGMMGRRMGYSQGKLAVTPREKQLAAQYGDKKRITRGDVITAAKKKSGKRMQANVGGGADSGRIGQLRSDLRIAKNLTEMKAALKKADKDRNKFGRIGRTRPKPDSLFDPNNPINIRKKEAKKEAKEDMK